MRVEQNGTTGRSLIGSHPDEFDTLQGAMAWCIKTGRTVIMELDGWEQEQIHKLPDHHNKFATAFWVDKDVSSWHCVFSADNDA